MSEIAVARINNLRTSPEADFVPPSEQLIALTYGQLSDLITQAVEKAIQPLQDEAIQLQEKIAQDREEIAALRAKIASLEATEEQDVTRICLDIAHDRRRITALEYPTKTPGKTEASRAEKIEKYLASRPDHRATFETLKGHLQIDNVLLNQAIKSLMDNSPGRYGIARASDDKRKRILVLLPR